MKKIKYIFSFKGEDHIEFNTCDEAIDWFTSKGYGMQNWDIMKDDKFITLEQFNDDTYMELFTKKQTK
jgi:hypothetical protein